MSFRLFTQRLFDRLRDLVIGGDLALLTNRFAIHKHGRCAAYSHLLAQVEVRLDICLIFVCVKALVEGIHVQPNALRHGLQTGIAKSALIFTVPVGIDGVMHLPELTLFIRAHGGIGRLV